MPTKAWAFVRSTHPGPSVSVTVLAAILSWGFSLGATEAIVVVLSVLLNQFSVGLSNDAIDASRDREAKRGDKPPGGWRDFAEIRVGMGSGLWCGFTGPG